MAKNKFYVVWKGQQTGVFDNWNKCKKSIEGFPQAQYKGFPTLSEAEKAFKGNYYDYIESASKVKRPLSNLNINQNSICVDAACSGNPGLLEYRCVDYQTSEVIFERGPFKMGTNNIGEFLALVLGIIYLTKNKSNKVIYTDSMTAISWVRNKKVKTNLEMTPVNQELFNQIAIAETYLKNNSHSIQILKWDTEHWGEIPADYGRK